MKKRSFLLIALALVVALCCAFCVACKKDNTISFEIGIQGYTGAGVASKVVKTGDEITLPAAPTVQYYEFEYWKLGDDQYDVGDTYVVEKDGDITFTAVYAELYELVYSVADGVTAPQSKNGRVGETVTLEDTTDADGGYSKFINWIISGDAYDPGDDYTPVRGLNTVTANYEGHYVLTYAVEAGLVAPQQESGIVGVDEVTLQEAPEKEDYEFEGWLINGTLYDVGDKYEPAVGVTIATAQYKLAYVYVTFEIDAESNLQGNVGEPVRVHIDTVLDPEDIPALTSPTKLYGVAWYNGETEVDIESITFSQNATITAKEEYVGTDKAAFVFTAVEGGYTVEASLNYASYADNKTLYLPPKYRAQPVVGISEGNSNENAFGQAAISGITTVYLTANIKTIGNYAFYANTAIQKVIYPEDTQLERIGANAFHSCSALTTLSDSESKTGLYIPASVKTIAAGAFKNIAAKLRVVDVYFDVENGALETIGDEAFAAPGSSTNDYSGITLQTAFPSTLKTIGEKAFFCNAQIGRIDFGDNATITTIGENAFGLHTNTATAIVYNVTSLVIPKSVTSIGAQAFRNHQNLAYVEFEEGSALTALSSYIFANCNALAEIQLPAGLTTIGQYAFNASFKNVNNGAGADITIPASVTKIDANAFDSAYISSLSFEEGNQALTIGEKAFSSQYIQLALTVPARVTSIGAYAFWKANLTELNFEAGELPLTIEDYAFDTYYYSSTSGVTSVIETMSSTVTLYPFNITSIEIPARTVKIGVGAFFGQILIEEITFAQGCAITEIPAYAFANTAKLKSINIPATVTIIGDHAFSITSISGMKSTVYNNGAASTKTNAVTDMDVNITKITIPASVELIAEKAFYNRGLKLSEIEFLGTAANNGLTIEQYAFGILNTFASALDATNKGNVGLTSVTFPANLVSVGGLFVNGSIANITCQYLSLTSIDLSACTKLTTLGDNFMAGTSLSSISIPASVTEIGNYVFANKIVANGDVTNTMTYSGKITLPAGLTSLGSYLCAGVSGVTEFEIASSNANYKTVNGVIYTKDGTKLISYPFGKTDETYTVLAGCTTIGEGAFKSNPNIKTLEFNDVKVAEGTYAFAKTGLTSVNHEFETLNNYAFFGCESLVTANINVTGEAALEYIFQKCISLTTVTLGENISALGQWALGGCTSLKTVNILGTLTKLGNNAFNGSSALVSIDLSNVTDLGTNIFQNATSIEEVTLGAITTIGANVFNSTNLKKLTLLGDTMATLGNVSAFNKVTGATIYVKADLIEGYQAATNWSTLVNNGAITFVAITEEAAD